MLVGLASDCGEMRGLLAGELNLPMSDDEFLLKANELYQQAFPSAELLPGAERLIRHLADNNIPMGTCVSSRRRSCIR